jgi:periplasmic divalent cation tolerance protein
MYWWEGAVQEDAETVLILKTRRALVERAVERIKALHSYDCPCVVALAVAGGNPEFLDWIVKETSEQSEK